MTDIFARKPLARDRAPVPKFSLFIEQIEAHLVKQRETYDKLTKQERLYNTVRDAVATLKLPNDQKLTVDEAGVRVTINALPTDRVSTFDAIVAAVERALVAADMRAASEELPAKWSRCEFTRRLTAFRYARPRNDTHSLVGFVVELPDGGIADLKVTIATRSRAESYYHFTDVSDDADAKRAVELREARLREVRMRGKIIGDVTV